MNIVIESLLLKIVFLFICVSPKDRSSSDNKSKRTQGRNILISVAKSIAVNIFLQNILVSHESAKESLPRDFKHRETKSQKKKKKKKKKNL